MRMLSRFAAFIVALFAFASLAHAGVSVNIDLSAQRMKVYVDGNLEHDWAISSGKKGFTTPTGVYRPYRMHARYFSRKYNNAPMHNAIFFRGGYAIHATTDTGRLGRPASHGCIRLHPTNARTLFNLVNEHGRGGTRIALSYGSAYDNVASNDGPSSRKAKLAKASDKTKVAALNKKKSGKKVVLASNKKTGKKLIVATKKPGKTVSIGSKAKAPPAPFDLFRGTTAVR
jgi:hypothetical protein